MFLLSGIRFPPRHLKDLCHVFCSSDLPYWKQPPSEPLPIQTLFLIWATSLPVHQCGLPEDLQHKCSLLTLNFDPLVVLTIYAQKIYCAATPSAMVVMVD